MKKIMIIIITVFLLSSNYVNAQKNCSELNGTWYYCNKDADAPITIAFKDCKWAERGDPMGDQHGECKFSPTTKKIQIFNFGTGDDAAYFIFDKNYSYVKYKSSFSEKNEFIIFSRAKHKGDWYKDIRLKLEANNKL